MSCVTRNDRRACCIYVLDLWSLLLLGHANVARAIALVYNQNGNADRRVNEKARFEINEIRAAKKLRAN